MSYSIVTEALMLPARRGMPSEIAFLRDRYPVDTWSTHPNYGDLCVFWLRVYDTLLASADSFDHRNGSAIMTDQ